MNLVTIGNPARWPRNRDDGLWEPRSREISSRICWCAGECARMMRLFVFKWASLTHGLVTIFALNAAFNTVGRRLAKRERTLPTPTIYGVILVTHIATPLCVCLAHVDISCINTIDVRWYWGRISFPSHNLLTVVPSHQRTSVLLIWSK